MRGLKQFPLSRTRGDIDTVVHDFVTVAEDAQLDHFEQVLENSVEILRVGRIGPVVPAPAESSSVVNWNGDGFTWEADPKLTEKLLNMLKLSGGKGAFEPWRQGHRER